MFLENNLKKYIIKLFIYIVLIIVFSIFLIKVLVLYDDEVFFEKDWKNNLKIDS